MKYHQFRVDDLETRLGILGETHIYNARESEFSRKVVPEYDVLLIEGGSTGNALDRALVSTLYIPALAYIAGLKMHSEDTSSMSHAHPTARDIAIEHNKYVWSLRDAEKAPFSTKHRLAMAALGTVSTIASPLLFYHAWKHGEIKPGADESRKGYVARFLERFIEYAVNNDGREEVLADIQDPWLNGVFQNVLLVCGQGHVEGVIEKLRKKVELHQIEDPILI